MSPDTLLILADGVNTLLLDADNDAPVPSLRLGLFVNGLSPEGGGAIRLGL